MADKPTGQPVNPGAPTDESKVVPAMGGAQTGADVERRVAALRSEREAARDDDHRKQIDAQLADLGHKVGGKDARIAGDRASEDDDADDKAADKKAADVRAAASAGDKTAAPEGRATIRGKQTSA